VPTTQRLNAVDFAGAKVWLVGDRAVALKSMSGGASWAAQNLQPIPGPRCARCAWRRDSVFIAGGGGFMRRSTDGAPPGRSCVTRRWRRSPL
jgi:photosystem II stability/assembly factor-like uncharacterized protein